MSVFSQITCLSPDWTTATIFQQIQGEEPAQALAFLKQ